MAFEWNGTGFINTINVRSSWLLDMDFRGRQAGRQCPTIGSLSLLEILTIICRLID